MVVPKWLRGTKGGHFWNLHFNKVKNNVGVKFVMVPNGYIWFQMGTLLESSKFKTNIRNGKYFKLHEVIFIIHVIEYQYRGLPHAHMVFRLDNAHDIDTDNQEDLIDFVNRNFIAELP